MATSFYILAHNRENNNDNGVSMKYLLLLFLLSSCMPSTFADSSFVDQDDKIGSVSSRMSMLDLRIQLVKKDIEDVEAFDDVEGKIQATIIVNLEPKIARLESEQRDLNDQFKVLPSDISMLEMRMTDIEDSASQL